MPIGSVSIKIAPCLAAFALSVAVLGLIGCSILPANPSPTEIPSRPARTRSVDSSNSSQGSTGSTTDATNTPDSTDPEDDTVSADLGTPNPRSSPAALPAGITIVSGRVTDAESNPIAGAAVTVPQGTSPVPERAALTNANGEYRWSLRAGVYTIQVNADGYKTARAEANTQQQLQHELNFKLERE